jgi:hypothetical protein
MSLPTREQAEGVLQRCANILEEWDDSQFVMLVLNDDGEMSALHKTSQETLVVSCKGILDLLMQRSKQQGFVQAIQEKAVEAAEKGEIGRLAKALRLAAGELSTYRDTNEHPEKVLKDLLAKATESGDD